MTYPGEMYYSQAGNENTYTSDPTPTPDIDKFLKFETRCFIGMNRTYKQKLKKIILADWTAQFWSYKKTNIVLQSLEHLIEHGFELYLWQEGTVVPLTKDKVNVLSSREIRTKITLEDPKVITLSAIKQQKQMTYDNLFVMDDYWLDRVIHSENVPIKRQLKFTEVSWIGKEAVQKLLRFSQKAGTKVEQIVIDLFFEDLNTRPNPLELLTEQLPGCPITSFLEWFIIPRNCNTLEHIQKNLDLSHVKRMEAADTDININDLNALLAKTPCLERLDLESCQNLTGNFSKILPLLSLKILNLSSSGYSAADLVSFLEKTPNIEELNLDYCNHLDGDFTVLLSQEFKFLKRLKVDESKINANLLKAILDHTYQIEYIQLRLCTTMDNIDFCSLLPKEKLSTLKSVDLACSEVSGSLNDLIKKAPNIQKLHLGSTHFKIDDISNLPPTKLEQVHLSKNVIPGRSLQALIAKSPHLVSLDLKSSTVLDDFTNSSCICPKLSKINAKSASLSAANLKSLIESAPALEELQLEGYKRIPTDLDVLLPDRLLTHLKIINLNNSHIKVNLKTLLKKAPALKSLNLSICTHSDDLSELPPLHLEVLQLDNSTISADNLIALLEKSRSLKELKLNALFNNLNKAFLSFSSGTCFKELKKLHINECNLSIEDIQILLQKTPFLESLELDSMTPMPNLFYNLPKEAKFPYLKRFIPFYLLEITVNDLCRLIEMAPNLEELSIRACKINLSDFLDALPPGLELTQLKHLSMSTNQYDLASLQKLALIAPNLKNWSSLKESLEEESNRESMINWVNYDPSSKTANQKKKMDADTRLHPDKKFKLSRIFYSIDTEKHPKINEYRLETFNQLNLNPNWCSEESAFEIYNQGDLQLIDPEVPYSNKDVLEQAKSEPKNSEHTLVYGKQKLLLNENWQALASLSPAERMRYYNLDVDANQIQLAYSQRDNLYYIRSKQGNSCINFDFVLEVPVNRPALPAKVQQLVNHYSSDFGAGALVSVPHPAKGIDFLKAITKDQVGACRHRALAFKGEMEQQCPEFPTRIVLNDCHAFAEVLVNGQWLSCQLGGYPAILEVKEHTPKGDFKLKREVVTSSGTEKPVQQKSSIINPYNKVMETWSLDKKLKELSIIDYCQDLLSPKEKSKQTLITLNSRDAVHAMLLNLQQQCKIMGRPIFYIHGASELVCKADFMSREGDTGKINKGPGGALHAFLKAKYKKDKPPVLIINYANFKPSELIALNALLDKERRADGIAVPKDTHIIGVLNTQAPDVYEGSDFYSRFDKKVKEPVSQQKLDEFLNKLPIQEKKEKDSFVINLYRAPDWKAQLLGCWIIEGGRFRFEEGVLKKALAQGKPIEIKNGLWEDPEFKFFWQGACALGEIRHNGELIHIPKRSILTSEGYDWELLKTGCCISNRHDVKEVVLNPNKFSEFFSRYDCHNQSKHLFKTMGLLDSAANAGKKKLNVYVTRDLNENDWARLLNHALSKKIKLQLRLAEGVCLPESLHDLELLPNTKSTPKSQSSSNTVILYSNNPDTTIERLKQVDPLPIIIDISECKPSDLLIETRPYYNKSKLTLEFTQKRKALLKALDQGKHILLTGKMSEELADALAPLILARQKNPLKARGTLTIVTNPTQLLSYAGAINNVADKPASRALDPKDLRGLRELEYDSRCLGKFNPGVSEQETKAFNASRQQAILDVLDKSPFVFLSGLSGVGKSTFIEKEFMQGKWHKIYHSEKSMKQWALDKSHCPKFLFIDEANLSSRQWSEFEGLFYNDPPTLLINGTLHSLDKNHKVIFAGNPINYGDDRSIAPFFERHGYSVVFDPLPLSVIFEKILKPVFIGFDSIDVAALAKPILEAYLFLCTQSSTEILISPRELQMMALLTRSYCNKVKNSDPHQVASHYAYELTKTLVPAEKIGLFEAQFGTKSPFIPPLTLALQEINASPDFHATPSRLPLLYRLEEFLLVRDMKCQEAQNDAQKYGGLGGIILEGDSSVGKTCMVTALLKAHGFKEVHNFNVPTFFEKPYYRMNVAMSLKDKEKLLIKAFYEGAVVVIDEINSSPMMERLLNDLLMGVSPDKNICPKPGFMIIGTQNPATMAGRRAFSTAFARRLLKIEAPHYPENELLDILMEGKNYPEEVKLEFELLVDAFMRQSALAKREFYNPAPTLRDVFKEAEHIKNRFGIKTVNLDNPKSSNKHQHRADEKVFGNSEFIFFRNSQRHPERSEGSPALLTPSY